MDLQTHKPFIEESDPENKIPTLDDLLPGYTKACHKIFNLLREAFLSHIDLDKLIRLETEYRIREHVLKVQATVFDNDESAEDMLINAKMSVNYVFYHTGFRIDLMYWEESDFLPVDE